MPSPFPPTSSIPGKGHVHLTLLPPSTPTFSHLTYTYPLKLLPSTPHKLPSSSSSSSTSTSISTSTSASSEGPTPSSHNAPPPPPPPPPPPQTVPLLFLLTYGGGLVAGDHIDLTVRLDAGTRLTVTTQGSTKIYRPPPPPLAPSSTSASTQPPTTPTTTTTTTRQDLAVDISAHAALWLAPDPVQPFADSLYAQRQTFNVERGGSLGFVDWVSEGRKARGERWAFAGWRGRNEVWDVWDVYDGEEEGGLKERRRRRRRRLLVRDAVVLDGRDDVRGKMDGKGVFGTMVLRGPLFERLAGFLVEEFKALPRIGGRNWSGAGDADAVVQEEELTSKDEWRRKRLQGETEDGVLWTACHVRGCSIVKFAAAEVQGAKSWLGSMLREEGSVGRDFGDRGLMFVR